MENWKHYPTRSRQLNRVKESKEGKTLHQNQINGKWDKMNGKWDNTNKINVFIAVFLSLKSISFIKYAHNVEYILHTCIVI